jgi:hypothetical protein
MIFIFQLLQNQWLTFGFIAADKDVIDLKYNLRSQMFAKSLPMIRYWLIETFRVVCEITQN